MTSVIVEEVPGGLVNVTLPSDIAVTIELPSDPYPLIEVSGARGATGAAGGSTSIFQFRAKSSSLTGDPGVGYVSWNNATQRLATILRVDILDHTNLDVSIGLASLEAGNVVYLQDYDLATAFQEWEVVSVTRQTGWYDVAVILRSSGGPGNTNFVNNTVMAMRVTRPGPRGKTILPPLCVTGNVTLQTGVARLYNDTGVPLTITKVRASVGTPPTGAALEVDVKKNGASIFGIFKPRILDGANTGTQAVPSGNATFADGDYLTVDVTAIGSTLPGANLVVTIATA